MLHQKKNEGQLLESMGFMAALTFVGGYLDAYTYITRGGVFANNQTANIAKLGIELFYSNWWGALNSFLPMLACIAGAFVAEHVKNIRFPHRPYRWRQVILIAELLVLTIVGLVPVTVPHMVVNLTISFITAFQLSAFRKFEGWIHNTTISTGNLRSLGQYLYQAIRERDQSLRAKVGRYAFVVFSFALGAVLGTAGSYYTGAIAVWVCSVILIVLFCLHRRSLPKPEETPEGTEASAQ